MFDRTSGECPADRSCTPIQALRLPKFASEWGGGSMPAKCDGNVASAGIGVEQENVIPQRSRPPHKATGSQG